MCSSHATLLDTHRNPAERVRARPGQYSELGERIDSDAEIDHCRVTAR